MNIKIPTAPRGGVLNNKVVGTRNAMHFVVFLKLRYPAKEGKKWRLNPVAASVGVS